MYINLIYFNISVSTEKVAYAEVGGSINFIRLKEKIVLIDFERNLDGLYK